MQLKVVQEEEVASLPEELKGAWRGSRRGGSCVQGALEGWHVPASLGTPRDLRKRSCSALPAL